METWDSPCLPCKSMLFDDRGKQTDPASRSKKKGRGGGCGSGSGDCCLLQLTCLLLHQLMRMLLLGVLQGFTLNYHNPLFCRFSL